MFCAIKWGLARGRGSIWGRGPGLFLALLLAYAPPVIADEGADDPAHGETAEAADSAAREIWSGGENFGSTWAFYTGITAAPDGDITQPGLRLRLLAGMSTYDYRGSFGRARAAQPFADLLGGYQWQVGAFTLKAFAGATGAADIRTLEQALDLWGQTRIGPKVVGEAWWTINDQSWASLDVALSRPQSTTLWSRVRYGLRLLPQISLGPEAGLSGEAAQPRGRIGAFARFDWPAGEIAASGGVAETADALGTGLATGEKTRATPYLTLTWAQRF